MENKELPPAVAYEDISLVQVVQLVSAATKTTADKDEDGGNDEEENKELSPAKTVVSTHRDPSFCKFHKSGYWLSGELISFSETGSDKDEDGRNYKKENKELSPAKAIIPTHG